MIEPEHPVRPVPSEMIAQPNRLFRWVGRWMFDRVPVDHEAAARVKGRAEEGQLIYVMRTRSKLDYLFFNYFFLSSSSFANLSNHTFFYYD